MRQFTQANRRLKLHCPAAGDDVLQLVGFTGVEELSRPFKFTLELISNSADVRPPEIVGQRLSFCIVMPDAAETERWFDGFVSGFTYRGSDDRAATSRYEAHVVPWIWFMGRTTDCRIFQNHSAPEIIREVLGECPHVSFDDAGVQGTYAKREYCVQYRESDLDFVSRLMEEEGIFYFFKHEDGAHKLILTDSKSSYIDCIESSVTLHGAHSAAQDEDLLLAWEHRAEFRSGALASTDYNYKTPATDLGTSASTTMKIAGTSDFELFEYPGNYPSTGVGDHLVNMRMEEQEATHDVVSGRSRYCSFQTGGRFTITKHYNAAEEGKAWALISVRHEASLAGSYTVNSNMNGSGGAGEVSYSNDFVCIPAETTFRPRRITPRPMVGGLQTAVVVGEGGQEIQVDDLGRIRLQFFWDRRGKKKADVSRWVRVAQSWAGPGYGSWFLPRVGNEVVVAFEDGDPDRPLCVGSVYHATNKQPFAQAAHKTQSGIKSRSTPGGGAANFNEIRFEDKKGGEELYFHAEKNQTIVVENNRTETVGHDRTEKVDHDETITIMNNRTDTVHGNETRLVDKNRTRTVQQNETVVVSQSRTHTIGINEAITIGAAQEVTVGATQTITVGAMQATIVGADQNNTIAANQTNNVGSDRSVTVGKSQTTTIATDRTASVGGSDSHTIAKTLAISAGDSITLKTGDASITMKKDGTITIKGKDITIEGSGAINVKASKNVVIKGQKILQN